MQRPDDHQMSATVAKIAIPVTEWPSQRDTRQNRAFVTPATAHIYAGRLSRHLLNSGERAQMRAPPRRSVRWSAARSGQRYAQMTIICRADEPGERPRLRGRQYLACCHDRSAPAALSIRSCAPGE
jgi:hypothetical protein